MDLSVVVPTLNGRDQLSACLDALAAHAGDAEIVVVNGPSADGTTGMVRERDDVDVLVEISDRTVNVARNAGIEATTGDTVAIVDFSNRIGPSWRRALAAGFERGDVVTGPVREPDIEPATRTGPSEPESEPLTGAGTEVESGPGTVTNGGRKMESRGGMEVDDEKPASGGTDGDAVPERRRIAGRDVTYFAGGNVAFRRPVLRDLDGFDEYLHTGGARDMAHRLAALDHEVVWDPDVSVIAMEPPEPTPNGDPPPREWGWKYRALAYRLLKNYGIRPGVVVRTGSHAIQDATSVARDVVRGDATPSSWVANGRDVLVGITTGTADGMVARARDRTPARNPNGISKRADRAVALYDARSDRSDSER